MKTCYACKLTKPLIEFAIGHHGGNDHGTRHKPRKNSMCKTCKRDYNKKWYLINKDRHKAQTQSRTRKTKSALYIKIIEYLKIHPCVDCGNNNPIVLEFDHRNKDEKTFTIAYAIDAKYQWEIILKEIKKCDVRCANCHRMKTARDQRSYKWQVVYNK